jgi:DNA modification methylase
MISLHNQDCLKFLKNSDKKYDCIFLDPPDNIGYKYEGFVDTNANYISWLFEIIRLSLDKSPVVWLSYNSKHDFDLKYVLHHLPQDKRTFIWRYTFGQYCKTDCASGYRPILRLSDPSWKPNVEDIKVPSKRMLMGDKRAAGPRVPDDVWDFPRITGNNKERRSWHSTQHPEALLKRIFLMSNGKKVLDCFCGSGTSIRVAKKISFHLDACEISDFYCKKLSEEHFFINGGSPII